MKDQLLDAKQIKQTLTAKGFITPYELHLFKTIDSTNRYLKDLPPTTMPVICCAEEQTQGRGRFNRTWHSPFGENIYCSIRWNWPYDLSKLSGLSLITSLAVLAMLNELTPNPDIKVKWPNDILWRDRKLCGSLIEIAGDHKTNTQVIIGIGLNVNSDTKNHPLLEKPWCSLYEIHGRRFDRNVIISSLIIYLEHYLEKFIQKGLDGFLEEWDGVDYLKGKMVTVNQTVGLISGKTRGVTAKGELIFEDKQGVCHNIVSGDTDTNSLCYFEEEMEL